MNVFKSLFGSLIGAAIGIGIYFAIKQSTGETYIWFPIVIGALIGMFGNFFYSKPCSNGVRFVCGALAAIVAFLAVFGVDLGPTLLAGNGEHGPIDLSDRMQLVSNDGVSEKNPDGSDAKAGESEGQPQEGSETSADGEKQESEEGAAGSGTTETSAADGFKDRGLGQTALPSSPGDPQRFAELIKKSKNKSWLETYLPYLMNGIGMLLAYQFARGFGSAPIQSPPEQTAQTTASPPNR